MSFDEVVDRAAVEFFVFILYLYYASKSLLKAMGLKCNVYQNQTNKKQLFGGEVQRFSFSISIVGSSDEAASKRF